MQFLKTLFWCLLAFVAAIFAYGNWTVVPIQLWGGVEALVNLPLLLLVTFLAGLVPTLAWHSTLRWRLRNRLATVERTMVDLRAAIAPPPPAPLSPDPRPADPEPASPSVAVAEAHPS